MPCLVINTSLTNNTSLQRHSSPEDEERGGSTLASRTVEFVSRAIFLAIIRGGGLIVGGILARKSHSLTPMEAPETHKARGSAPVDAT